MTESPSLEPSIALAAYAEPLASNRRVLVFGNALASLSVQLLERGARSVHVCDADPVRVAEAVARNRSSQISFSSIADSDLSVRDGAFELALVENLGAFGPMGLVRKAKRALAPRGAALIACPNPEAAFPLLRSGNPAATTLDYYALYDSVAAEFEHVRMLGQTPFVGYAIADFSASGEPEPALDTSFVPGGAEEPDLFIALASEHEVRLDEFAVIQLPTRRLLAGMGVSAPTPAPIPPPNQAAEAELARLNQWLKELESRASTADERADHADTELEELRAKLETEPKATAALKAQHERELSSLKAQSEKELASLKAELSARSAEIARASAAVAERDRQLAEQNAQLQKHARVEQEGSPELTAFEAQLLERGAEIRRLERDLRTAERTGRELVRELARRGVDQAALAAPELERALAEREADLQAAAWTIESLSLRLELAGKPLPREGGEAGGPETARSIDEAR
jgi:SAM-dependent methyltransferase